jgi:hypothetical protein
LPPLRRIYERRPKHARSGRRRDGVVVFQDADGGWSEDFARAAVHADAEATRAALARAKEDEARDLIVEPYAVVVEFRNGHFVPKALRELIRASGPTIHPEMGKQAHGLAPVLVEKPHVSV